MQKGVLKPSFVCFLGGASVVLGFSLFFFVGGKEGHVPTVLELFLFCSPKGPFFKILFSSYLSSFFFFCPPFEKFIFVFSFFFVNPF